MNTVILPLPLCGWLQQESRLGAPKEVCGLMLGLHDGGAVRVHRVLAAENIAEQPETGYLIDPEFYLHAERQAAGEGRAVVGVYHSHPHGKPIPSETDLELAWPDWSYVIVGADGTLRSWRLEEKRFKEEAISLE